MKALVVALAAVLTISAHAQGPDDIFTDVPSAVAANADAAMSERAHRGVVSRRLVGLRLDRIFGDAAGDRRAGERLGLNLPGSSRTAVFERLTGDVSGHRSWIGSIAGVAHSLVVITERDGVVSGIIDAVDERFQMRTSPTPGVYALEQLELEPPGEEREPLVGADIVAHAASSTSADRATDDRGVMDVLMLYTPAARTLAGGATQIQAAMAQIVSTTNTIFSRSGITTTVRLVGTSEFALTETASIEGDLNTLTSSATALTLRNQVGADLVQLVVSSPSSSACGIAWMLTRLGAPDFNGYSIADYACLGQYTPSHEMGHNMGSHHDRDNASGAPLFDYSYGHRDPARGFRTVMAYSCSNPACPRIANFSNPDVMNAGGPTGTSVANNALSINNAAQTIANWRQTVIPPAAPAAPTGLQAQPSDRAVSLSWNASAGATGYILQVGTATGRSDLFNNSVGAVRSIGSQPIAAGTYFWRVIAVNAGGSSPPSLEQQFTVTTSLTTPAAPANLRSTVNGNLVTVAWDAVPGATEYRLQAGMSAGASNLHNASIGNLTSVSGVVANGTYFWRVMATNSGGSGPASSEAQFTVGCTAAPGAPQNFVSMRSGRSVTLTWSAPVSGGAVSQYVIEAGSAATLSNLAVIPTGTAAVSAVAQAPPGTYFVRIRAQNSCGTSAAASNEQLIVVP